LKLIEGPFRDQMDIDSEEYEKLPTWMKINPTDYLDKKNKKEED